MELFKPKECLILIVDDVTHNIRLLDKILDGVGYNTVFAKRTFEKSLSISETPILSLKGSTRKPYSLVTTNPFQTSS